MIEEKTIDALSAAKILDVSQATIKNWIKSGILDKNLTITSVNLLKASIATGNTKRLNQRANKSKSEKIFIPIEYANDDSIIGLVSEIVELSVRTFNSISETLFNFVIAFIDKADLADDELTFKRNAITQVIDDFNTDYSYKANRKFIESIQNQILKLKNSTNLDVLGLVYQSLLSEGDKSKKGSYYTPSHIIDSLINELQNNITSFLDPCCGTGAFLLSAIKLKKISPENIFGADLDRNAVFLARINVLIQCKDYNNIPNILHVDSLNELATSAVFCETTHPIGNIDAIATNPPWGANKNRASSEKYASLLGSKETFSMFLVKALELLKEGGEFNFLLPESILNIKTHKEIRKILCQQTQIQSIKEFRRVFTGVYTPVVSIHAKKQLHHSDHDVKIQNLEKNYLIKQEQFTKTTDYIFDIKVDTQLKQLIDKIYSTPHYTLKNSAKWALGIVTGNNKAHIKDINSTGSEPIYKGSDICYFYLKSPSNFINYDRSLYQQIAKEKLYRADEKLVYKFISNKLVFAYDSKRCLTLNSANILIPEIPDTDIKIVLSFFNSKIFQFLHNLKFSTHKILRKDLETLPIPVLNQNTKATMIHYTNKAINGDNSAIHTIDQLIFDIFNITETEKNVIIDLTRK